MHSVVPWASTAPEYICPQLDLGLRPPRAQCSGLAQYLPRFVSQQSIIYHIISMCSCATGAVNKPQIMSMLHVRVVIPVAHFAMKS